MGPKRASFSAQKTQLFAIFGPPAILFRWSDRAKSFSRSYLTTIWEETQFGAFSAMFPWNITCGNRYFVRFSVYLRPVSPFFCAYGRWSSRQYETPSPKFGPIFPNIVCNFWERKVTGVALCLGVIIVILQKNAQEGLQGQFFSTLWKNRSPPWKNNVGSVDREGVGE